MRAAADSPWRPFTAGQVISIPRPAFAWVARMQSMQLLATHILDCYVDGKGRLEARLCGSLPLARMAGSEVCKGELMRYLAEFVWAPHAQPASVLARNRCEHGRNVRAKRKRRGTGAANLQKF
jgi:hypothetical protein